MIKSELDLLLAFYKESYPYNLSIDFPIDFNLALEFKNFNDYAEATFHDQAHEVRSRREIYLKMNSPQFKLNSILKYLSDKQIRLRSVMEVGSGSGNNLFHLEKKVGHYLEKFGIDPLYQAVPQEVVDLGPTWLDHIGKFKPDNKPDLILCVHTLHHISLEQQVGTIAEIGNAAAKGTIFYLVEDSWGTDTEKQSSKFDAHFSSLSRREKQNLFCENENWANTWFRSVPLTTKPEQYRPIGEWESLFMQSGFESIERDTSGFDQSRLHGVPMGYLIMKKA